MNATPFNVTAGGMTYWSLGQQTDTFASYPKNRRKQMTTRTKRPTTAKVMRQEIEMLEAQLTIKDQTIRMMEKHQRQLTEALATFLKGH
jgi:hypothetical protein